VVVIFSKEQVRQRKLAHFLNLLDPQRFLPGVRRPKRTSKP
jgi:hypothetical protein